MEIEQFKRASELINKLHGIERELTEWHNATSLLSIYTEYSTYDGFKHSSMDISHYPFERIRKIAISYLDKEKARIAAEFKAL